MCSQDMCQGCRDPPRLQSSHLGSLDSSLEARGQHNVRTLSSAGKIYCLVEPRELVHPKCQSSSNTILPLLNQFIDLQSSSFCPSFLQILLLTEFPVSSTSLANSGSTSEWSWQTRFLTLSLRRKPAMLYSDLATFYYMLWTHISHHSYFLCSVVCLYFMFSFSWKIQAVWFSLEVKNCQFI